MPNAAFALRDHGFRVQSQLRDEEPVRWLFKACLDGDAPPCVAYRATIYARAVLALDCTLLSLYTTQHYEIVAS